MNRFVDLSHMFPTGVPAAFSSDSGARIAGIDSCNIDDMSGEVRPVHNILLGADIPIVEHMRKLENLPDTGFRFYALPPRVKGFGAFPLRAFAVLDGEEGPEARP